MKKIHPAILILILVAAVALGFGLQRAFDNRTPTVASYFDCIQQGGQAFGTFPPQCLYNEQFFVLDVGNSVQKIDEVVVDAPRPHEAISGTYTISGKARGTWFFEASAPILITASDGTVLLQTYVEATDDWMTTDFVRFERSVTFDPKGYTEGYFAFKKDNPSGLPENDDEVRFPIRFTANTATSTQQ